MPPTQAEVARAVPRLMDGNLVRGSDSAEGDIGHAKIHGVEGNMQQL